MVFNILAGALLSVPSPAPDIGLGYIRELVPTYLKILRIYICFALSIDATCNKPDISKHP
jgi:hypothetical protein